MKLSYTYNKIRPTLPVKDAVFTLQKRPTLLCFSHLRWNFVYQRPQHLMARFADNYDVLYIEEPIYVNQTCPSLSIEIAKKNVYVLLPHIPDTFSKEQECETLESLLKEFIVDSGRCADICWYYTPMMLQWSKNLASGIIIYDCMDELSAFKFAPAELKNYEQELMQYADLVFTGGASLYKAKSPYHKSIYLFPSSVDIAHFQTARNNLPCPVDQISIPGPRIGFYGVVDERFDINLLEALAKTKSDWNFVIIGPVVKINYTDLPKLPNIHYIGSKKYEELPYYLSNWEIAFIPFAINESTKFISPTKTPEYLAGGKVVVSTPITDIVATYGNSEVVHIADPKDIPAFINAIKKALKDSKNLEYVCRQADIILNNMSWDKTSTDMQNLMLSVKHEKKVVCDDE